MPECEGNCEKHVGPVQRVHVWHGSHDWGEFWYCQTAIAEDRRRGFTVEIIDMAAGKRPTGQRNDSYGTVMARHNSQKEKNDER